MTVDSYISNMAAVLLLRCDLFLCILECICLVDISVFFIPGASARYCDSGTFSLRCDLQVWLIT